MNNVTLIGRLTRDPELAYTPNTNTAKCTFTLAVDRAKDDEADYPRIIVWGKQAENCGKYLSKGRQVAINGRIQTGKYQKQDGTTVYTTDVVAFAVEFLGGKAEQKTPPNPETTHQEGFAEVDEYPPF